MSKNLTDSGGGHADNVKPITTDSAPSHQDIFPPLITVPGDALLTGLAYKNISDLVVSTWFQASSTLSIGLNATQNTVILNVPLFNDYTNPLLKLWIMLHDRANIVLDYRVTVFGSQNLTGAVEMGVTATKITSPTINDLRVIEAKTAPINGTVLYTFSLGTIVGDDGRMRNFWPIQGTKDNPFDIAGSLQDITSAYLVVLNNIPIQSAITSSTEKIYMRIESRMNPMSSLALVSLSRTSQALQILTSFKPAVSLEDYSFTPRLNGSSTTPFNLNGLSMNHVFGSDSQLYMSLDGLYSIADAFPAEINDVDHMLISYSEVAEVQLDLRKEIETEDEVAYILQNKAGKIESPSGMNVWVEEDGGYKLDTYTQESTHGIVVHTSLKLNHLWSESSKNGVKTFRGFPTELHQTVYGWIVFSDTGYRKPPISIQNLQLEDFVKDFDTHAATYVTGNLVQSINSILLKTDPSFTFKMFQYKQSTGASEYGPGVIPKESETRSVSLKLASVGAIAFGKDKTTRFIIIPYSFVSIDRSSGVKAEEYSNFMITTGNLANKKIGFGVSYTMDMLVKSSDLSFSVGEYIIAPTYDQFNKVPEYTRRVVFSTTVPPNVSIALSTQGLPIIATLPPKLFPKIGPTELLVFDLITPNNNQTIMTICWDPRYEVFYMHPVLQTLPLYAVYNTHNVGQCIIGNMYRTTIGNLPPTSLAKDFITRVISGNSDDKIILKEKRGPTLTVVTRDLLEKILWK